MNKKSHTQQSHVVFFKPQIGVMKSQQAVGSKPNLSDEEKEVLDYLREGARLGYSLGFLKKELELSEYPKEEIKYYITKLKKEKIEKKHKIIDRLLIIIALLIFIEFVVILSLKGDFPVLKLILAFSPILINIILSVIILEKVVHIKSVIWTLPFFTSVLFYVAGIYGDFAVLSGLEIAPLAIFNLIGSLVFVGILSFVGIARHDYVFEKLASKEEIEKDEEEEKHVLPDLVEEKPMSEQIKEYLGEITGKSNAINLAINKVYKQSKGGSFSLRNKIRILSEWAKELKIKESEIKKQRKKILSIIHKIEERVTLYFSPEKDVFTETELKNLKELDRDRMGRTRIIDILIDNGPRDTQQNCEDTINACAKVREFIVKL